MAVPPTACPSICWFPRVAPGNPKRRGVELPAARPTGDPSRDGLEAALFDHDRRTIAALESVDERRFTIAVAGPVALLVAKLQKITDRQDVYRLLRTSRPKHSLTASERLGLGAAELTEDVPGTAAAQLRALFGSASASRGTPFSSSTLAGVRWRRLRRGDPHGLADPDHPDLGRRRTRRTRTQDLAEAMDPATRAPRPAPAQRTHGSGGL
jgi:hypothetical protein